MNESVELTVMHNALKFVFLVREYPKKKLEELTNLMAMPGIDVNLAIWHAVDAGWIVDPSTNEEEDPYVHLTDTPPQTWDFGPSINDLKEKLLLAFAALAKKETDLQWEFMSTWLMGYAPRDVMIVLKQMLAEGVLAKYKLTDPKDAESVYDFYTLPQNRHHLWGAKAFKVQPTEETVEAEEAEINEDAADDAAESEK